MSKLFMMFIVKSCLYTRHTLNDKWHSKVLKLTYERSSSNLNRNDRYCGCPGVCCDESNFFQLNNGYQYLFPTRCLNNDLAKQ